MEYIILKLLTQLSITSHVLGIIQEHGVYLEIMEELNLGMKF
jgi:hypothetical protein